MKADVCLSVCLIVSKITREVKNRLSNIGFDLSSRHILLYNMIMFSCCSQLTIWYFKTRLRDECLPSFLPSFSINHCC